MNPRKTLVIAMVMAFALNCVFVPANAGMFDDPKNLKVLPEDISSAELRATMRGFAINTDSRCSDCHVHEDEKDFSTYDFPLDDKEKKRKARTMIRMVNNINSYLAENLGKPAAELVKVDCATCHRGLVKPEMLQDVLARTHASEGLDSAIDEYRSLRERYYGGYSFDFTEGALMNLAERIAKAGDPDAALIFLDLNIEYYPESAMSYAMKGQVHSMKGDVVAARSSFTKSLEIEPDNRWTKRMLDSLDADHGSAQ